MPTKKQLAELKKDIAAHVAEGFSSRAAIVGRFTEDPDEESYGELDEGAVEKMVDQAIAAHHAKQATWSKPTDCDKLDVVFRSLNRKGILARQNFSCCSNCGHYEMESELKDPKHRRVTGYAFYHLQDTESAVEGGGIHLKYDAVVNDPVKKRLIGQTITDALTAAGLKPDWDGNPDTAVYVPVKWKKRRKDRLKKSTTAVRRVK
jgi:hypothetical protein